MPNLEASYCHHVFLAFYILFPKTPTSPYGDSKNASNIMTRTPMVAAGNTTTDVVAKIRKGKSNLHLSEETTNHLMSVGCSHIVQNAVHTASGCLPVGIQSWEKSTTTFIFALYMLKPYRPVNSQTGNMRLF